MIPPRLQNGGVSDRVIHGSIAFLVLLFLGFLFFMANLWLMTAGSVRVEAELRRQLPGLAVSRDAGPEELPDEVVLALSETGMPSLNDEPVEDLPRALAQLRENAGRRRLVVTLQAHPQSTLEDVTRVMEALAKAKIENVTFVVGSAEGF